MRKWNSWIVRVILILLFLHGFLGSFFLLGISTITIWQIAVLLEVLVGVHALLSICMTVNAIRARKQTGKWYAGMNAVYWGKRVTGIGILILLFFTLAFVMYYIIWK